VDREKPNQDDEVDSVVRRLIKSTTVGEPRSMTLEQKLVSGYDGYGGVHDNLLWNVAAGYTYFTLNNKLIIENTKTREQAIFADSSV